MSCSRFSCCRASKGGRGLELGDHAAVRVAVPQLPADSGVTDDVDTERIAIPVLG
jgi:hypothetical protein